MDIVPILLRHDEVGAHVDEGQGGCSGVRHRVLDSTLQEN